MTIQDIITRKEDQTFDCKSVQIEPKALAITIVRPLQNSSPCNLLTSLFFRTFIV